MAQLAIQDDVLAKVAAAAKARGISTMSFVQDVLLEAVHMTPSKTDRRIRLEAIAAMTPMDRRQTDAVVLLRQDRDA